MQRDAVVSSQLIPETQVANVLRSPRGEGDQARGGGDDFLSGPLAMLTRIFGVKKTRHEAPDTTQQQNAMTVVHV